MEVSLNPDGPHSPDYTREVAAAVSEAVRVLNHATGGPSGLQYPGDVYDVLGSLSAGAAGLQQALDQMVTFIHAAYADGRAVEHPDGPYGGNARKAFGVYAHHMGKAQVATARLADSLNEAQQAISWLEGRDGPGSRPT